MMIKVLSVIGGIIFVFLALAYFLIPANELADWIPGADPNLYRYHYTHGVASLAVGGGLLVYGWLRRP
jgi:predicted PurR-regulated permease PerM